MKQNRVLVTGAGGGVGQGIIKALRLSGLPLRIISADISPLHAGLYRSDEAMLIPRVESEGALEWFLKTLVDRQIDVLMVGSEFDLRFFATHRDRIHRETGTMVCASPVETVEMADDKFLTTEFLREHDLPHARAVIPNSAEEAMQAAEEYGLPVVLKSRTGTSARNVHIIHALSEIDQRFGSVRNPMLQEFAGEPGSDLAHEYTCSVFTCKEGTFLGPFTARRTLRGGSSWLVEVDQFAWLHPLLLEIAAVVPSMGSLNVQLRDGPKGPIPFEFNSRFSGTTAIRAHFGFNEPAMFLRNYYLGESVEQPSIKRGMTLRYLEEVFIDDLSANALTEPFPRGTIHPWF